MALRLAVRGRGDYGAVAFTARSHTFAVARRDYGRAHFHVRLTWGTRLVAHEDFGQVIRLAATWFTWGAVGGTTAGELLRVGYTITRPAVRGAQLQLADGRSLAMTVADDHLEVLLPADTPAGRALIVAELEDDAGVTATATLEVLLSGIPAPPQTPVPSPGGGPSTPELRLLRSPARVRITPAPGQLRRRTPPRTAVVHARPSVRRIRTSPVVHGRSAAASVRIVSAAGRVRGQRRGGADALAVHAGATTVTRRDGPGIEEALLLGLL